MEAKHYFPGYPKLKTEKGVWREDYWCGGKEIGVAAPQLAQKVLIINLREASSTPLMTLPQYTQTAP